MFSIDTEAWQSFLDGPEERTFAPVYDNTRAYAYTICYRVLRNEEDAQDAVQSFYARLLQVARQGDDPLAAADPEALVSRLAYREADRLRKRRARRRRREVTMDSPPVEPDSGPSADQVAMAREMRDRVETLIEILPEHHRLPLLLHFFHGLTHRQIAAALDVPATTVGRRIARGLKRLRPLMVRAGLGDAVKTLAAVLAGGALLAPSSPAGAASVFAAASGAGVATGGLAVGGSGTYLTKLFWGSLVMKTKIAIVGAIVVIAAVATLPFLTGRRPARQAETPQRAAPLAPAASANPDGAAPRREAATGPVVDEPVDHGRVARVAQTPSALEPAGEDDGEKTPVWTLDLESPGRGERLYFFQLDDRMAMDPRNWRRSQQYSLNYCHFLYPLRGGERSPEALQDGGVRFVHHGAITRAALFIAPFRGGWWGMDEFEPANAAARRNLNQILLDPTLSFVKGRVVDPDGVPIPRARVRAVRGNVHLRTVEADADGNFAAGRLPCGKVGLLGRAPGFFAAQALPVEIRPDGATSHATLVLQPAGIVTGAVLDESGAPIAGAVVTAVTPPLPPTVGEKAWTDDAGHYTHGSLEEGGYHFLAEAPGYAPAARYDVTVGRDTPVQEVSFRLAPGGILTGRVVEEKDGEDEPVGGATITLIPFASEGIGVSQAGEIHQVFGAVTDGTGDFTCDGLPFGVRLGVYPSKGRQRGERHPQVTLTRGIRPKPLLLRLEEVLRVTGRVIDTEGEPVAGASVFRVAVTSREGDDLAVASKDPFSKIETDEEGAFAMDFRDARQEYGLRAEAEGFAPAQTGRIAIKSGQEIDIVVGRGGSLAGRVVLSESGAPLAGAEVTVSLEKSETALVRRATTDEEGLAEIVELTTGSYQVAGRSMGTTVPLWVIEPRHGVVAREGERTEFELIAHAAATVRGTVTLAETGAPVAAAQVAVTWQDPAGQQPAPFMGLTKSAATDKEGRFEIQGLAAGALALAASKRGMVPVAGSAGMVTVRGGEESADVRLVLSQGGTVSGLVLDAEGEPVPRIRVSLKEEEGNWRWVFDYPHGGQTDMQGRFRVAGVPFLGVRLRAQASRSIALPAGVSEWVNITPESPRAEVTIRLGANGTIVASLVNREGELLRGQLDIIRADPASGELVGKLYGTTTTADDGRFHLGSVPAGVYRIQGRPRMDVPYLPALSPIVHVEPGKTTPNVDITVERAQILKGLAIDLRSEALASWDVRAVPSAELELFPKLESRFRKRTSHRGEFQIETPPGNCRLHFSRRIPGGDSLEFATGEFQVSEDERVFVLPAGGTIRGRVVRAQTEEPVPGASVFFEFLEDLLVSPKGDECALTSVALVDPAMTNADGIFERSPLPLGRYRLTFESEAHRLEIPPIDQVSVGPSLLTDLGPIVVP